jgi:transcriptional regulator with XRE-family HTH domain
MNKKILERQIKSGKTQREIATELNVSQTTIRHWLKKFNLTTGNSQSKREKKHLCKKCGVTDKALFYGNDKEVCGECHNNRVKESGKEKRAYAVKKLGGKCISCGYKRFECSLDIHHTDPTKKDINFKSMRGWSLKRIDKEIEHCVLLCKNCHTPFHNGLLELIY